MGRGPLLALVGLLALADSDRLAGRSLLEAIRLLQAGGLGVIFSSELVRPDMTVTIEPKPGPPAQVLAEILRPHGLTLRPGPSGRLVVVRTPPPAPPADPPRPGPPIAFGSEVRVVRIDVSVLDRRGRFVTDLGSGDFEVLEDGRAQDVVVFARREVPLSLVLLLDASSSMADRLPLAKAAAAGFLGGLGPRDEASVVEFNDSATVLQEATSEPAALRASIARISAEGGTALYNSLYATLSRLPRPSGAQEWRRRAVLLVSDGEDTASLVWEEQVLELARRREAAIHTVDVGARAPASRSARLLRALSGESGGRYHRLGSISDLEDVYARIGEELRSQYTLGYQPSAPGPEGRWRRVEIRVRGARDVEIRHRSGYYAQP